MSYHQTCLAPIPSVDYVLFLLLVHCFFLFLHNIILKPLHPFFQYSTWHQCYHQQQQQQKSICTSCVCVCAHELLFVCAAVFLAQLCLFSLWVKGRCFSSWLPFSWSHLHGCVACPYRLSHRKLGCLCECSFAGPAVSREKKLHIVHAMHHIRPFPSGTKSQINGGKWINKNKNNDKIWGLTHSKA